MAVQQFDNAEAQAFFEAFNRYVDDAKTKVKAKIKRFEESQRSDTQEHETRLIEQVQTFFSGAQNALGNLNAKDVLGRILGQGGTSGISSKLQDVVGSVNKNFARISGLVTSVLSKDPKVLLGMVGLGQERLSAGIGQIQEMITQVQQGAAAIESSLNAVPSGMIGDWKDQIQGKMQQALAAISKADERLNAAAAGLPQTGIVNSVRRDQSLLAMDDGISALSSPDDMLDGFLGTIPLVRDLKAKGADIAALVPSVSAIKGNFESLLTHDPIPKMVGQFNTARIRAIRDEFASLTGDLQALQKIDASRLPDLAAGFFDKSTKLKALRDATSLVMTPTSIPGADPDLLGFQGMATSLQSLTDPATLTAPVEKQLRRLEGVITQSLGSGNVLGGQLSGVMGQVSSTLGALGANLGDIQSASSTFSAPEDLVETARSLVGSAGSYGLDALGDAIGTAATRVLADINEQGSSVTRDVATKLQAVLDKLQKSGKVDQKSLDEAFTLYKAKIAELLGKRFAGITHKRQSEHFLEEAKQLVLPTLEKQKQIARRLAAKLESAVQ